MDDNRPMVIGTVISVAIVAALIGAVIIMEDRSSQREAQLAKECMAAGSSWVVGTNGNQCVAMRDCK